MKPAAAALSATLLFASSARATPPATFAERQSPITGIPATPTTRRFHYDVTASQAVAQIEKIAAWDVTMQSTLCPDPDAGPDASFMACETGGIIEVQSGPGMAIVASDNTQETIGIWNINDNLNGVAYPTNIAAAFSFLSTHPGYLAWQVAGDPGPDYYSVYNCGWGVRAVMLYEATTGDMSHHAYGETCAQHIATNAGALVTPTAPVMDVGPAGWAASGLWLWGDTYPADAAMKTTAATIGGQVKAWIEAAPILLTSRQWSMTGGAPYYGVIESYMRENPAELLPWVTEYAPMLAGWIDESTPADPNDWTDWRNAWNGWNMLAQFTSAQVLGSAAGSDNEATATDILTKLVAQAGATSGAIAGSQQRPSTEAESWITAYMVYFGLLEIIDEPAAADAGVDGRREDAGAREAGAKDAGSRDAGHARTHDAEATADAGAATDTGGGCSCGLAGHGGTGTTSVPLAALVLGLFAARKRARLVRG